jgi:hypothetical protein
MYIMRKPLFHHPEFGRKMHNAGFRTLAKAARKRHTKAAITPACQAGSHEGFQTRDAGNHRLHGLRWGENPIYEMRRTLNPGATLPIPPKSVV